MKVRNLDKYVTKVDRSGRFALRNRSYLKKLYQEKDMFATAQTNKKSHDLVTAVNEAVTASETTDELTAPKTDRYGSSSLPCPKKPSVPSSAKYLYHCKRRCKMPRRAFLLLPIHCLHLQLPGDRLKPQEGILLFCSKHS